MIRSFLTCTLIRLPISVDKMVKSEGACLKIDHDNEVYISELKSGKGGLFYVYGQLTIYNDDHFNDFYGFITKYANNGDTIWTHTYRHPSYNQEDYFHYINDLIEEDNGDLTVLGSIAPIGGKNKYGFSRSIVRDVSVRTVVIGLPLQIMMLYCQNLP
ncbi:hypothetical protein [Candidatus Brachybacter algidus]|uniref:hypothetical protein n=1 Tax=Candidatus Brachybacter algidus TaxID=2982024 RepID=UPI001D29AFDD|nr:hypothetical protein [Candidatus Brachybacter algidus]MBK6451014.1 hypothetical protein [Candidatus Brachybacter algidus]